jgi:hypothetical protein
LAALSRVIVCGSRGWTDRERIADRLFDLKPTTIVVHGSARGADRIAHQEAEKLGLSVEAHPADWQRHGKRAGHIRNEEMAALGADLCIAFWDGSPRGTMDMTEAAARHRIAVEIQHKEFPNRETVR